MQKAIKLWDQIERYLSGAALAFSIFLMLAQVIVRYFFSYSIYWAEEYVRYAVILGAFLGYSCLVKTKEHISITAFTQGRSESTRKVFNVFNGLASAAVSLGILWGGVQQVLKAKALNVLSETIAKTPMYLVYYIVPIGGALLLLRWLGYVWSERQPVRSFLKNPASYIMLALYAGLIAMMLTGVSPLIILLVAMIVMMGTGMPIAFAIGTSSVMALIASGFGTMATISSKLFASINSFTLLAIPFFIVAGEILTGSNLGKSIFDLFKLLFKNVTGGLGIAVMVASMFFAAISGSSVANAAALGMIAIPMLSEAGYPRKLSAGILTSGGTLAVIIPPSAMLILYGSIAVQSVGDLFKAGIIPGVLIGIVMCVYIFFVCRKGKFETKTNEKLTIRIVLRSIKENFLALLMPVIILGLIYAGVCTPTESAAIATGYALIVALAKRDVKPKEVPILFSKANNLSAMIYAIIMMSGALGFIFSLEQIPQKFMDLVLSMNMNWWQFLILVNIIVFAFGFFMGQAAILIIMVPIILPVAMALGISPIHLGILLVINMEIAYLTPPVGSNLYIVARVGKMPLGEVIHGTIPFIIILLAALFLITFFPGLTTMLL